MYDVEIQVQSIKQTFIAYFVSTNCVRNCETQTEIRTYSPCLKHVYKLLENTPNVNTACYSNYTLQLIKQ